MDAKCICLCECVEEKSSSEVCISAIVSMQSNPTATANHNKKLTYPFVIVFPRYSNRKAEPIPSRNVVVQDSVITSLIKCQVLSVEYVCKEERNASSGSRLL